MPLPINPRLPIESNMETLTSDLMNHHNVLGQPHYLFQTGVSRLGRSPARNTRLLTSRAPAKPSSKQGRQKPGHHRRGIQFRKPDYWRVALSGQPPGSSVGTGKIGGFFLDDFNTGQRLGLGKGVLPLVQPGYLISPTNRLQRM